LNPPSAIIIGSGIAGLTAAYEMRAAGYEVEVLEFRDQAFQTYFSNTRYLDMVTQVFGRDTRNHVEDMAQHRLKRKLLEELDAVG